MQDNLTYDTLYTKLSAAIVISVHEIAWNGKFPDITSDVPTSTVIALAFIGFGEKYSSPPMLQIFSRHPIYRSHNHHDTHRSTQRIGIPQQTTVCANRQLRCFRCRKTGHWKTNVP